MNKPLIYLTPTTAKMLAKYHASNGSPRTEERWLTVALTLYAVNGYNEGHLTEIDMHAILDLAETKDTDWLRVKGYELLEGC